jgi:hypothetical protein
MEFLPEKGTCCHMNQAYSVRSLRQATIVFEAIGAALLLISLLTPWITVPGSTNVYFIIPSTITYNSPISGSTTTTFIAPLAVSVFQSTETLLEAFMVLLFVFGLLLVFAFVLIKSARDSAKSISLFAAGALLLIPLIYIFFSSPSISRPYFGIGFTAAFLGSVLVLFGAIPLFFSQRVSESKTITIPENLLPSNQSSEPGSSTLISSSAGTPSKLVSDNIRKLQQLKEMLQQGLITQEEYDSLKKEMLDRI